MHTGRQLRKRLSSAGRVQPPSRVDAAKKRGASMPPEGGKRMMLECVLLTQRRRRFSIGDSQPDEQLEAGPSNTQTSKAKSPGKDKGKLKTPNKHPKTPLITQKTIQRTSKRKRASSPPAPPTSASAEAQPLEQPLSNAEPSTTTSSGTAGSRMSDAQAPLTTTSPTDFVSRPQRRVSPKRLTPPSQNEPEVASEVTRPAKRPRRELQLATPPPSQQPQVVGTIVPPLDVSSHAASSSREDSIVPASIRDPSLLPEIPAKNKITNGANATRVEDDDYQLPSPPSTSSSSSSSAAVMAASQPTATRQDTPPADFELLDLPDTLALPWMATAVSYVDEDGKFKEQNVFLPPGIGCLVEAMKHTLSCERAALRNVETRYEEEVRKRFVAEHHVEVLAAENARLREVLRKCHTDGMSKLSPEV